MWSAAKIASIFILFAVAALFGLFPRMIKRCLAGKLGTSRFVRRIPGALNCFSGGIFFAVVILDLLPESREDMEDVLDQRNVDIEFPFNECILGVGFLFVLFLEHIALLYISNISLKDGNSDLKKDELSSRGQDHFRFITSCNVTPSVGTDNIGLNYLQDEKAVQQPDPAREVAEKKGSEVAHDKETKSSSIANTMQTRLKHEEKNETNNHAKDGTLGTTEEKREAIEKKQRTLTNYVFLIILTVHMFFDGVAIGLLNKDSLIWQLLLAQCIHKSLVFVTIGIQVQQMYPSMMKVGLIILYFAMVSPISVIIGALISSIDDEIKHKIVSSVLMSFSAGNFLFITFFEILQRELADHQPDLLKVFSTFVGFASFALLRYFISD